MSKAAVTCFAALVLFGLLAQAQAPAPPADPNVQATITRAIQEAKALRKVQEALSTAVTEGKATRASVAEQITQSEKSFQALREAIDKIDEQYDSLIETHQSAVREAWSLAKLFGVLFEQLKESAATPDSPDQRKDLLSDCTSTARRAVMLDETLSRMNPAPRTRRQPAD
ncbi:MAG TPA: hypothetical protein VGK29_20050 [Paludibaculum sp.]|jgi:septal ring factor EnvC (AmiA/AmiB activator)